ncbi:MAG: hypothetical protein CMJ58_00770 [Planctomycetaceae bacterium]|nr:hypothetical protein [Planctomycetaceae bacterium]
MIHRRLCVLGVAAIVASAACSARGQIEQPAPQSAAAPRLGPGTVCRYRTGAVITASRGAVRNINAMVAAPLECPEQTVQTVDEDISPTVKDFRYRMLNGDGARQMLISIPGLANGDVGRAVVTYEVVTHTILPPLDPSLLTLPSRRDKEAKRYLNPSPYIEVGHRHIRRAVEEALAALEEEENDESATDAEDEPSAGDAADKATDSDEAAAADAAEAGATAGEKDDKAAVATAAEAESTEPAAEPTIWEEVEALYDYTLDHVKYEEGVDKSAVQVLGEGVGDCQAIGALFVAMCRTHKVPARLVWVHDHQYAEFYLADETGEGHWYPIETAGTPAFGEMRIPRVILQKGDNFRVKERRGEKLRYASDFLTGLPTPGGGKPSVKYIREPL